MFQVSTQESNWVSVNPEPQKWRGKGRFQTVSWVSWAQPWAQKRQSGAGIHGGHNRNGGNMQIGDELGYIYFVIAPEVNLIKIGFSRSQPDHRLQGLQQGCPVQLERLAHLYAHSGREKALHRRFSHLRVRGEWFRADAELIRYTKQHAAQWRPLSSGDQDLTEVIRQQYIVAYGEVVRSQIKRLNRLKNKLEQMAKVSMRSAQSETVKRRGSEAKLATDVIIGKIMRVDQRIKSLSMGDIIVEGD